MAVLPVGPPANPDARRFPQGRPAPFAGGEKGSPDRSAIRGAAVRRGSIAMELDEFGWRQVAHLRQFPQAGHEGQTDAAVLDDETERLATDAAATVMHPHGRVGFPDNDVADRFGPIRHVTPSHPIRSSNSLPPRAMAVTRPSCAGSTSVSRLRRSKRSALAPWAPSRAGEREPGHAAADHEHVSLQDATIFRSLAHLLHSCRVQRHGPPRVADQD